MTNASELSVTQVQLYHYSEICLEILTPQNGARRHSAELLDAAGIPGVWLTDDSINPPVIGDWRPAFRHTVVLAKNDSLLLIDTSFETLKRAYSVEIGTPSGGFKIPTRYFYRGSLNVAKVEEISLTMIVFGRRPNDEGK